MWLNSIKYSFSLGVIVAYTLIKPNRNFNGKITEGCKGRSTKVTADVSSTISILMALFVI
jgi:hypothetical protein